MEETPKAPEREPFSGRPPRRPPNQNWTKNLVVLITCSIIGITFLHYGTCMLRYRWMEWQYYKHLIDTQGLEKVRTTDLKYLEDPACTEVNKVSFATLTGLLATIIALNKPDGQP